jgi:ankyrin repeat protein
MATSSSTTLGDDLRDACQNSDEAAVKQLLKDGVDVNSTDKDGYTALHYAASGGSVGCCRLLLTQGADINVRSVNGCTPLYMAAQSGYTKTVNELIAKSAQVDTPTKSTGHTPLLVACEFGYPYIVQALLAAGADVKHCLQVGVVWVWLGTQLCQMVWWLVNHNGGFQY